PLTVGVFGTWGSGKTSLMRMLRDEVESDKKYAFRTVWFTAWKYDQQDALWRALLLRVIDALYPRETGDGSREDREILDEEKQSDEQKDLVRLLNQLEESVYQAVDWEEIGPRNIKLLQFLGGVGKASAETAAFLSTAGFYQQIKNVLGGNDTPVDDIQKAVNAISKEAKKYNRRQLKHMEEFETTFQKAVKLIEGGRLIVFVDDLDRCLPEKAIEVIEAIKLFLEAPGVVFVLGMDKDIVQEGIKAHYGAHFHQTPNDQNELPISGDSYLQKIIQIPFHLPSLVTDDLDKFIGKLAGGMNEHTRQVIAQGVIPNPRQVKRVLNIFNLLRTIADTRFGPESHQIADPLLAKTVLIQTQYPRLYQLWRRHPLAIQILEESYDRDRISDVEMLTGRRPSRSAPKAPAEMETDAETIPREQNGRKPLLFDYLENRVQYALLAQMLTYPPVGEAGEGRMLARFAGLDLAQLEAYVRLAGAVESETAEAPPIEIPADFIDQFLSGDELIIRTAASQLESEEPEQQEAKRSAVQERLVQVVTNPAHLSVERVSAGKALAFIGDPRPGVG
ncbi:MAG: P-loop NTPase fold protein, partial [Candidatus Promineifilaceae bacterium]